MTGAERPVFNVDHRISLYIHIPFCKTKCGYCDFNTYSGIENLIPQYLDTLTHDLQIWGNVLDHPVVPTVFLGGGTPSLLSPQQMRQLLAALGRDFDLEADGEITAEINPDDVDGSRLEGFRSGGINRISFGVQTLDDDLLGMLGRRHTAVAAIEAYSAARRQGFSNINVDLMYGLPHQTLQDWKHTLETIVELKPEHISSYCLTVEPGTALEVAIRTNRMPNPDSDLAADMYEWGNQYLESAGYIGYEIANWALPGFESKHNLTYWQNRPYLGIGPGAHSSLGGYRFNTVRSPIQYIKRVYQWADEVAEPQSQKWVLELSSIPTLQNVEKIDPELEMAETVILGLRLKGGIDLIEFSDRFSCQLTDVYGTVIEEILSFGLIHFVTTLSRVRLCLTDRGRLLGNEVFWRFLPG